MSAIFEKIASDYGIQNSVNPPTKVGQHSPPDSGKLVRSEARASHAMTRGPSGCAPSRASRAVLAYKTARATTEKVGSNMAGVRRLE